MGAPDAVVVGTSFGCLTHVRALRAAGFDVIGLVGRDPERTVERARRFDVPHPTTSLSEALELPGVDAVTDGRPVAADPAPATFADGVANMKVLDAIRSAAATGSWVVL